MEPINMHDVGYYYKSFFSEPDIFNRMDKDHKFQNLTESNKEGTSYRKGLYITNVIEKEKDSLQFNLLRCSTNLDGPTENFSELDRKIVQEVNLLSKTLYPDHYELNHVLAQIYYNTMYNDKPRKAKITEHSDKTKDMPHNGLMAFCTFYKDSDTITYPEAAYTKLRFRMKEDTPDFIKVREIKKFDIVLLPNSLFIMNLESNRYYTHEIIPSSMPINKIPIRLGYVIRSSKTIAVYDNKTDKVYINDKPMILPSKEDIQWLKNIYYKENTTSELIDYGNVYFSLNDGDYKKPIL